MILNDYGKVAHDEWEKLAQRFPNFELDVFRIMPNHMHGIIVLNESVGAGFTPAQEATVNDIRATERVAPTDAGNEDDMINGAGVNPAPTVSDIVDSYKSLLQLIKPVT